MTHRWTSLGTLAQLAFSLLACGGSTQSAAASDGGGVADTVAPTGELDSRATVPVTELNETGPPAPTGPVMCSGKMCSAPSGGQGIPLVACCLSDNTCGLTFDLSQFGGALPGGAGGGIGCLDTTPGSADPSCPSQSVMGFAMAGCCSKAGVCGFDLSMLSMGALGCNSQLGFPGFGMGPPMNTQPQTCGGGQAGDAGPRPHDASAGVQDASSSQQDGG